MQLVLGQDFRKARILGEKSVAGMHGVGTGDLASRKQRRNIQITVFGGRRADADAFVGEPHVHGIRIGGRMHRDRVDAQLLAGAQDAKRDLSPVGDQDFVEHHALKGGNCEQVDPSWPPHLVR